MNIYIPLLALFVTYLPQCQWVTGVVISVPDADTLTIEIDGLFSSSTEVIRLVYIDAPELAQGKIAKTGTSILAEKVLGQKVRVRVVGRGFYKRLLGEVFIGKESMNLYLLQSGYAFLYPWSSFLSYKQKLKFLSARDKAKKSNIGVWSLPVEKPWAFRRKQKNRARKLKQLKAHKQ